MDSFIFADLPETSSVESAGFLLIGTLAGVCLFFYLIYTYFREAAQANPYVTSEGWTIVRKYKEETWYWQGDSSIKLKGDWGRQPFIVFVPNASTWDRAMPPWLTGRREEVCDRLAEAGNLLVEVSSTPIPEFKWDSRAGKAVLFKRKSRHRKPQEPKPVKVKKPPKPRPLKPGELPIDPTVKRVKKIPKKKKKWGLF